MKSKERSRESGTWKGRESGLLRDADLKALLAGRISYLRFPDFLEPAWCGEVTRRFVGLGPAAYTRRAGRKSQTIELGTTLMDTEGKDLNVLFKEFTRTAPLIRGIFKGGEDPFEKMQSMLKRVGGWKREQPKGLQRDCGCFLGAFTPGAAGKFHAESLRSETKELWVSRYPRFLSWYVHLSDPGSGGEVLIYRRRRAAEDSEPASVELIEGAQSSRYRVRVGEALLFAADQYHQITATERARVVLHSFVGIAPQRRQYTLFS